MWLAWLPCFDLELGTPVVRVEDGPDSLDLPEFTHAIVVERVMLSEAVPEGEYDLWLPEEQERVTVPRSLVRVDLDTHLGMGLALRQLQQATRAAGAIEVQTGDHLLAPLAMEMMARHLVGRITAIDRKTVARRLAQLAPRAGRSS